MSNKEQQHPQHSRDKAVITTLLSQPISDLGMCELARLIIRYKGFPGANDIKTSLQNCLKRWHLTEQELFVKTRLIYKTSKVYNTKGKKQEEDWN